MAFKRFEYTKLWTINDKDTGFLTRETSEKQVREDLQYQPNEIRDFINQGFMAELETVGDEDKLSGAEQIGDKYKGNVGATLAELFRLADENHADILNLAGGGVPDVVRSGVVDFTADGWVEAEGGYELRILQSQHKRPGAGFGYKLQSLVGKVYQTNTWETLCTDMGYDEETGDIVLMAENPYSGRLTAFGV